MTAWLLDTLLYTGLLIGLVLLVRRPATRLFGPQFAYALWLLPFLRLLLPPIVLPASYAPEPEPVQAAIAAEWVELAAAAPLPEATAVAAPVTAAPVWSWSDLAPAALSVWLGVALAFLAWRTVSYRRMRRELLADARPVGEAGRVRLVETPAVAAPVAFGVFDKVVALPPLFMARPDRLGRDLAIEHELAHHRGHDLLANFAAQALLAVHWFNPLAWAGWRAMRRDQEAACDARVLTGRDRQERARYAALIAEYAAGPRTPRLQRALAAPMAGPLFGEKSIIHRLRSLSMSDITDRRRWLGRGLIAAAALALPLTASFSYSADAQVPEPPLPPAPPVPEAAPLPPVPPAAPVPPEVGEGQVRTFVLMREGETPRVQHFTLRREGGVAPLPPMPPLPPVPPAPRIEFHGSADPHDPEFEKQMEEFERQMEEWGEKFGEEYAAQAEAHALAMADVARNVPEVVESCDANERRRTVTADGRQRVVICVRDHQLAARQGLREARNAIARNRALSDEIRDEILNDLDDELERLDSEE